MSSTVTSPNGSAGRSAVEVRMAGLTRRYGPVTALDGLDLTLQPELFAINRNTPNAGVIFSTSFAALLFAFALLLILSYAGRRRRGRG